MKDKEISVSDNTREEEKGNEEEVKVNQMSNVEHQTSNNSITVEEDIKLKSEEDIRVYVRRLFKRYGIELEVEDKVFLDLDELGKSELDKVYKNNSRAIKLIEREIIKVKEEYKKKNELVVSNKSKLISEDNSDYLNEIDNIKGMVDKEGVPLFINPQDISRLILNSKGKVKDTQSNYTVIVKCDGYIQSHVRFNELKQTLEFNGKPISNGDLNKINTYVSKIYDLDKGNRVYDALNDHDNIICYNPVKDVIEDGIEDFKLEDGESYIDNFFEKICNRIPRDEDDAIYQREVARMIFYGGINRLYRPGCKFDYMPILVGKQGSGKSSIVDLLNPIRESYVDLRTIDGKEGIELIQGGFIIELSELLAFVRTKDAESMKSFVTRCVDKYRAPYDKITEDHPRSCVLIGTTNDAAFLTDVTGNRRYLPIGLYDMNAKFIYDNLDYVKDYINKCWKEALILMKNKKTYLHIPCEYNDIVNRNKETYTLEDPLFEEIRDYVNNPENENRCSPWRICAKELYEHCANGIGKCPTHLFKQFRNIMSTMDGWEWDTHKPHKMKGYDQKQRCWVNDKLREKYGTHKSDEDDDE